MATIRHASDRWFEAAQGVADATANAALALQERGLRFAQSLLEDAERWQKDQQAWLANGAELQTRWQGYGLGVARALLNEAQATQQVCRSLNEAWATQARVAAEAGQELAAAWSKLTLTLLAAPLGRYASQVEDLRERLFGWADKTEANATSKN
jgi:hypothetical protein